MPDTTCHMSMSLDGFVAGPDQCRENPWAGGDGNCTAGTSAYSAACEAAGDKGDGVESFGFEPVEVLHSPLTTHIRYRRVG